MFTEQQFSIPPLQGISVKTIEEHLKLYSGYVKNTNSIIEKIPEYQGYEKEDTFAPYVISELFRRFAFEWGGMRNHECYFKLLEGASSPAVDSKLVKAIEKQWGSLDVWKTRFQAIALTRGIGWAMLYFDPISNQLVNAWVDEQQLGQLAGCSLVIALDMWEHSYVADYLPSGKKKYVDDFMNQMSWRQAEINFVNAKNKV